MRQSGVLIFTTCYNERENIGLLIDRIAATIPFADILVVDDSSPDGTWDVIQQRRATCRQLYAVSRPRKLGIGSAHKYALFYAMREGYKTLVTMDADFSHDPALIPSLLAAHSDNVFVTGSRYCSGGSSDYSGYRDIVSRIGNKLARLVVGVHIRELTTYFRVFDVASLRRLPLRLITASGYSYGVELVYQLHRAGVELREVPIHFSDRTRGASKIPRLQILKSALDLLLLGLRRIRGTSDLPPDERVTDACTSCGDRVLAMKAGSDTPQGGGGRIFTCLACGLEQTPQSSVRQRPDSAPSGVEDAA
jgi:dolichol-phosphate mannosyltransferase